MPILISIVEQEQFIGDVVEIYADDNELENNTGINEQPSETAALASNKNARNCVPIRLP